jgi:hypothetical protein
LDYGHRLTDKYYEQIIAGQRTVGVGNRFALGY